jgi:transposase
MSQAGGLDRILHVHADNARPRTAKKVTEFLVRNGIKGTPHPPYSPNLAPRHFYLFGYIKVRLAGTSFEEPDQLLQAIDAIVQSIEKATFGSVFQDWMDRLAQYSVTVGCLVEGT